MWAVPKNLRIVESELATSLEQNEIIWTSAEQVLYGIPTEIIIRIIRTYGKI